VQKHSVFASIEMLDAFRYGKIHTPFGLVDFSKTYTRIGCPIQEHRQKHAFSPQSKCLTHSATEKSTRPLGLLIFPRLTREWAARFKKIGQKHGVFASIEMLDAFRYGKIHPHFAAC
jgi:hypothetical protein